MGTHLSLSSLVTCADIYNECNYARLGGDHNGMPVCDNDRRYVLNFICIPVLSQSQRTALIVTEPSYTCCKYRHT